jgi:hypothetical protein
MHTSSKKSLVAGSLATLTGVIIAACAADSSDGLNQDGHGANGGSGNQGGANSGSGANSNGGIVIVGGSQGNGGVVVSTGGSVSVDPTDKGPSNIDGCTGTDGATLQALQSGSTSAGGMRWLYPYDGTVFPRGLLSPVLQWDGGAADVVFVRLTSKDFTYQGCFGPVSAPLQVAIPQDVWDGAGAWSQGVSDPVTLELTTMSGGSVVGTIKETLTFALATLKGAIYYNTYTSLLAGSGAVLKITPGNPDPTLLLSVAGGNPLTGPCVSCHSLSADGMTMTANRHDYNPLVQGQDKYISASYDVSGNSATLTFDRIAEAGFAGVYKDGSIAVTNGPPGDSTLYSAFFPAGAGSIPALVGPTDSKVLDLSTGQRITANGWDGVVVHAQMPMFSPDGTQIVYNDYDAGQGHSLHVADFDRGSVTFSNHHEIFRDTTRYPGWPFFTPDGSAVIFALGDRNDFVSQIPTPDGFGRQAAGHSQLYIVYLNQPGTAVALNQANGLTSSGSVYLPHNDPDREFFPTVSPVAAGGYYWLFFTSRRQFGNTWNVPVDDATSKKIWVSAISAGANSGDTSHPAFILPGQEINTGNIRAFAALEPCKEDGSSCESGTECCNGFCVDGICQPPQSCANLDDRCETAADCCNTDHRCIGGFCSEPEPR